MQRFSSLYLHLPILTFTIPNIPCRPPPPSPFSFIKVLYGFEHKKVAVCLGIVGKLYSDTSRSIYAEGLFNKSLAILAQNRMRYIDIIFIT